MNRDLQSRIAADISDYCDLIVRKAGEKQRNEGLANAASQHRCSHPSDQAAARLGASRFDQLSEEHREPAQPNKRAGSNS
jgi:hypothetical protein